MNAFNRSGEGIMAPVRRQPEPGLTISNKALTAFLALLSAGGGALGNNYFSHWSNNGIEIRVERLEREVQAIKDSSTANGRAVVGVDGKVDEILKRLDTTRRR